MKAKDVTVKAGMPVVLLTGTVCRVEKVGRTEVRLIKEETGGKVIMPIEFVKMCIAKRLREE